MNQVKRIMALAGVILVAGIWIATFLIGVLGGSKELLTAFLVLSVIVPVLIYGMLLIARVVSGKPAKDEIDAALKKKLSAESSSVSENSATDDSDAALKKKLSAESSSVSEKPATDDSDAASR